MWIFYHDIVGNSILNSQVIRPILAFLLSLFSCYAIYRELIDDSLE